MTLAELRKLAELAHKADNGTHDDAYIVAAAPDGGRASICTSWSLWSRKDWKEFACLNGLLEEL